MKMGDTFDKRLKEAMYLRKIKASELSKKTNIAPPIISDYLKGKYVAKQVNIYLLAKALNVNESWLMGFDTSIERIPDEERNKNVSESDIESIKNGIVNSNKFTEKDKETLIGMIDFFHSRTKKGGE